MSKTLKVLMEIGSYLAIILAVILVRVYLITPVRVEGSSMHPTLEDGEILLLKKFDHAYSRFEIVVFNRKKEVTKNGVTEVVTERLVKRVIGLPGEHIAYKDGKLYVNEKETKEEFINVTTSDFDIKELGYDTIPEGYLFVMGDNRNNSTDSRILGPIKKEDIVGTTNFVLLPFSHFGFLKSN